VSLQLSYIILINFLVYVAMCYLCYMYICVHDHTYFCKREKESEVVLYSQHRIFNKCNLDVT